MNYNEALDTVIEAASSAVSNKYTYALYPDKVLKACKFLQNQNRTQEAKNSLELARLKTLRLDLINIHDYLLDRKQEYICTLIRQEILDILLKCDKGL